VSPDRQGGFQRRLGLEVIQVPHLGRAIERATVQEVAARQVIKIQVANSSFVLFE